MSDKDVVETIYGRRHKFEIVRSKGLFGSYSFSIHRDGSYHRGSFDSLAKAVKAAQDEG